MQKSHKESRYYPNNFQLQDSKAHPPRLRTVHMQVREGLTKILESSIFSQKVLPQQHILRYNCELRFFNISEFQQSTAHQLNQGRCSSTVSLNFISCIIAMFCSTVFVQIQSDSNSPIKSFITWCNSLQDHCHTLTLSQLLPPSVSAAPIQSRFSVSRLAGSPGDLQELQDNNIILNLTCSVQGSFPRPNIRIVRTTSWNTL